MTTMQKQFRKLSTGYEKLDQIPKEYDEALGPNNHCYQLKRLNNLFVNWFVNYFKVYEFGQGKIETILDLSKNDFIRMCCIVSKYEPVKPESFLLRISLLQKEIETKLSNKQKTN